jgi:hypothetical protein
VRPPVAAEKRTSTEPSSDDGGLHIYAAKDFCRWYFEIANGTGIVWIHTPRGARLPVPQTFRHMSARPLGPRERLPKISHSVRSTRTQDGRILLDVRRGQMFSVNVVGSEILELIEQGWDEARMAEEISRAYATTIEVARTDVHDFIEALRKDSILQASASDDSI